MMNDNCGQEAEWELRPCGMLVQTRGDAGSDHHQYADAAIKIGVSHGADHHELHLSAHSTFGDVKKALAQKIGLDPAEQKILFRGLEKEDDEQLDTAGVKDNSKVVLQVEPASEEAHAEEQPKITEEMKKALASIDAVREEVDKISERVAALEVVVNGGTQVRAEEFDMSAELLMRQLLKLDSIEAEGEARVQRKAEVRRVQNFHELLDNLKARNSNPLVDSIKTVSVTTEWETFDNGVGSLNPRPPSSSSTKVTQDWEQFD